MNRAVLCMLGLFLLAAPQVGDAKPRRRAVRLGIVPLSSNGAGAAQVAANILSSMVKGLRAQRREVKVLDEGRADRLRGCLQQPSCAQALASKFGLGYLVTGHVEKQGGGFHVDLRAMSGKTGEVMASEAFPLDSAAGASGGLRMAQRLLARAGGVKAKPGKGGDTEVTKSEAEAAAAILEKGDGEDPLEQAQPASRPKEGASGEGGGAVDEPKPRPPMSFGRRWWPVFTLGAVSLAAFGTGIGFGMFCKQKQQDARDTASQSEASSFIDAAKQNALVANILFGVGTAAALTSVILAVVEWRAGVKDEQLRQRSVQLGLGLISNGAAITAGGEF